MKAIYASKLYKASTRKDRIQAALLSQNNLQLVQQLAEDLGEEYQTPENLGEPVPEPKSSEEDEATVDDFVVDEEIDPETDLMTLDDIGKSEGSKPSHLSAPKKAPEPKEAPEKLKADTSDLIPESPANDQSTEPTAASTKVQSASAADLNILKGTLNSRADTAGVTRIAEKENEVWIYYNDDTNLNEIMTDVIEYLMTTGYESFEFNRLARSDNAIVFITERSTTEDLESIDEALEESK